MDSKEPELKNELDALDKRLSDPSIYTSKDYPSLAKRRSEIVSLLDIFTQIDVTREKIQQANGLLNNSDDELKQMAMTEVSELKNKLTALENDVRSKLISEDPNDEKNVIIEIRAAAGGDESSLFAAELYKMYIKWAENHQFSFELLSENPNELGGFKEVIFAVNGKDAYRNLKYEAGVHRVQRIPATESQGRVHTSTVTVAVLPEAEESDIEINPADLRIDVYRSSGHGGQSVNTTDSAVRITHIPTGIVVANQDEKSQIKNKAKALSILRARLLSKKIEEEQSEQSDARRKLIGSGDRSEKIRTYNFPQDRITDHRIGYSRSNIQGALAGDIDDLISKLQEATKELSESES